MRKNCGQNSTGVRGKIASEFDCNPSCGQIKCFAVSVRKNCDFELSIATLTHEMDVGRHLRVKASVCKSVCVSTRLYVSVCV